MLIRQTGLLDLRSQIEGVRKIAAGEQMRKTIENAWRKIQRLSNLARSAPARSSGAATRSRESVILATDSAM